MKNIIAIYSFYFISFTLLAQEASIQIMDIQNSGYSNIAYISIDSALIADDNPNDFQSSIIIEGFGEGLVIVDGNEIATLGILMEHSYLMDLEINLICPNNQVLEIKTFGGGGNKFLGEPVDIEDNVDPGIGYYYLFNTNSIYSDLASESTNYTTMPQGSYLWEGNVNSLINCPLNGEWTIEIVDHIFADNGYIFNWQLFFNTDLIPENLNSGSVILNVVNDASTDWYVEWSCGQTGLVATQLAAGEYTAWLKEEGTNVTLDSVHVFIGMEWDPNAISENDTALGDLHPNPANTKLELIVSDNIQLKDFHIYSMNGKLILNQKFSSRTSYNIDVSNLNEGMYLLEIEDINGHRDVKRFVVHH